ncbi:glycosyltransferase, partial [Candidatus Dojkabacteria bacterium]|nr:glycosyltransferase [Candidatus Dojkabacteria bacterium]
MLLIDKLANHSNNYPKLDLSSKSLQLTASIVIPSYNSAKTLKIVVSQLLKQTAVKQIKEIIVIDDNSQ